MSHSRARKWVRAGLAAGACGAAVTAGVAMAGTSQPAGPQLQQDIFSAYIDHGPEKGLSIWGALSGTVDSSGRISGSLKGDHPVVRLTGNATGRSVSLSFHLPGGRTLTGTGTSDKPITDFQSIPTKGTF